MNDADDWQVDETGRQRKCVCPLDSGYLHSPQAETESDEIDEREKLG
jgi:hypothetical protein